MTEEHPDRPVDTTQQDASSLDNHEGAHVDTTAAATFGDGLEVEELAELLGDASTATATAVETPTETFGEEVAFSDEDATAPQQESEADVAPQDAEGGDSESGDSDASPQEREVEDGPLEEAAAESPSPETDAAATAVLSAEDGEPEAPTEETLQETLQETLPETLSADAADQTHDAAPSDENTSEDGGDEVSSAPTDALPELQDESERAPTDGMAEEAVDSPDGLLHATNAGDQVEGEPALDEPEAAAHAAADQLTEPTAEAEPAAGVNVDAAQGDPVAPATDEELALSGGQVERVQEFLGELKGTLVDMAARAQTEPPEPPDMEPLVEAVRAGFERSVEQSTGTNAALTALGEHVTKLGQNVEGGIDKVLQRAAQQPAPAPAPAAPTQVAVVDARSNGDGFVLGAVALVILGWSVLFWIKTGSPRLALGTLIGANAVACCLLLARRRD